MKKEILSILTIVIMLFNIIGCGGDGVSQEQTTQKSTLSITVNSSNKSSSKIYSKQALTIKSMVVEVYATTSLGDTDYSNKSLLQIKAFEQVGTRWQLELSELRKNSHYIFVVSAFSSSIATANNIIFTGLKTAKIVQGNNDIEINLVQHANANNPHLLPHIKNLTSTKANDGSVKLSFTLANPEKDDLSWEIRDKETNLIADSFSANSGSINVLSKFMELDYLETATQSYFLILSSTDAQVSYAFTINIDIRAEDVNVTVFTAPIITKLRAIIDDTELTLTPVLDKPATSHRWEIVENLGSDISIVSDASAESISLSEYNQTSEFKIKLTVAKDGIASYRIYHIFGNLSKDINITEPPIIIPPVVNNGNLKKTHQVKSYDYLGDVENNIKDDGYYQKGLMPSYTKSGDVVTDTVTTLKWQDNENVILDWQHAEKYCKNSTLGGLNDWRLPTHKELDSLVDYFPVDPSASSHDLLLDTIFTKRGTAGVLGGLKYWSSFKYTGHQSTARAWYVDMTNGNLGDGQSDRDTSYYVRCVQGTMSEATFSKNVTTGVVKDSLNNLEWQDNGAFVAETWTDAMDRCENLDLDGSGWRLPNVNELKSIVNRHNNPRIATAFTSHSSFGESYWSSTAYFTHPQSALTVEILFGSSTTVSKQDKNLLNSAIYSRCVRDFSSASDK